MLFIYRIVSVLKVSSSNNESGYNAMKMLKNNIKNVRKEEINEISEEDNTKFSKKVVENIANKKQKQIYYSSGDSDQDTDYIVPSKWKADENKKHFMNRESDLKVENAQNRIEQNCKNIRQTILLSATLTQAVEKLAGLTMQNPIFVDAAKENIETSGGDNSEINEDLIVPESVIQSYIVTPPKLRMVTLSAYIAGRCQVSNTLVSI